MDRKPMDRIVASLAAGVAALLLAPAAPAQMQRGAAAAGDSPAVSPQTPVTVINVEPDSKEIVVVDDTGQQSKVLLDESTRVRKPGEPGAGASGSAIDAVRVGDRIRVTASAAGVAERIELLDVSGVGAGPPSRAPGEADPARP